MPETGGEQSSATTGVNAKASPGPSHARLRRSAHTI